MNIFRNVVFVAALAGLVAGIVMTAMQTYATVPLILQAETFESAGGGHDHGAAAHDHAAAPADAAPADTTAPAVAAHEHGEDAWAPADGVERFTYTALANIVTGIGFALVLVAVSEFAGGIANWRQGVFWGFAGFAVFTLAPGLGLQPNMPGMPGADLMPRQIWWVSTAAATAAGLALIAFRRSMPLTIAGVALIVVPHIVGAPQPLSYETGVPEGLHRQFIVAATVTNLVFWIVLGVAVGFVRSRFMKSDASASNSFA